MQYQRNLWTEAALTKFVTSLLNPLHRITTPDHLLELMTARDCVIVAFLDMESHSRNFKSFHRAALKFIERDPFDEVGFGIVVGRTVTNFGVDRIPTIRAYLWNETIEYTGNLTWTSREIMKWVQDHIQQVSLHLSPPGIKSSSLAPYMKQGPVMILFTPRNLYFDIQDSYVMLRQLGMSYFNCKDDDWVHEIAHDFLTQKRSENRKNLKTLREQCQQFVQQHFSQDTSSKKCRPSVSTMSYASVLNSSKNTEAKSKKKRSDFCEIDELRNDECECSADACSSHVKHNKYSYKINKVEQQNKYITSMLDNFGDEKSPEAIEKYNLRRQCEMLRLADRRSELVFIDDVDTRPLELISGLACKSNRTFTLISMDSISFHTFAERLGVDILEIENKTAAMIMDQDNESTYLLDEPINMNSLARFIYSYHHNRLNRFLRTNSIQYKHTHFFDINEFLVVKEQEKFDRNDMNNRKMCHADRVKLKDSHVVIREINSEDFDAVIKSNKVMKKCDFKFMQIYKNDFLIQNRPLLF